MLDVQVDRSTDYNARRRREFIWLERADIGDDRVIYIIARPERSAEGQAEIVHDYKVVSGFTFRIDINVIDSVDDGTYVNDESRLLEDLARGSGSQGLAQLDGAAGKAPPARERLLRPPDENNGCVGHQDHRADPDYGCRGIATRDRSHRISSDAWALKSSVET
jgi:hypothetical protein